MTGQILQTAILGATMRRRRAIAADYQATAADNVIFVDASAGNVNVTLPPSIGAQYTPENAGTEITIQRVDASGNTVTVVPSGADTIAGGASLSLAAGEASTLVNEGAGAWWPVAASASGAAAGVTDFLVNSNTNASSGVRYPAFYGATASSSVAATNQWFTPVDVEIDEVSILHQAAGIVGCTLDLQVDSVTRGSSLNFSGSPNVRLTLPVSPVVSLAAGELLNVRMDWSGAPARQYLAIRMQRV